MELPTCCRPSTRAPFWPTSYRGLNANALALALRVAGNRLSDVVRGRRAISAEWRVLG
jgi:hypothetical protein